LHQQLREAEENISKLVSYKAWNIAEDLSINQVISEGYDEQEKESNNS
jgi:predicted metal-dependent peptidase